MYPFILSLTKKYCSIKDKKSTFCMWHIHAVGTPYLWNEHVRYLFNYATLGIHFYLMYPFKLQEYQFYKENNPSILLVIVIDH